MKKKMRTLLAIFILLVSFTLLAWSYLPVQPQAEMQRLTPSEMMFQSTAQGDDPALLETRRIRLEWTDSMRIGDEYTIVLDFEQSEDVSPSQTTPSGFSNVYECCNVMAEARFEVAGINVDPANPIRESMPPGQPARFKWKISAEQVGLYHGTIWLSLRFLPLDGSTPIQEPIYVNDIQFETSSFFGLSGGMARIIGWVGVISGVFLLPDVWIDLAKRWKKRKTIPNDNAEYFIKEPKDL